MKNKWFKLIAAGALAFGLAACSGSGSADSGTADATKDDETTSELTVLKVGATSAPHAEILEEAKPLLKDKGYDLQITEFSDYPNINPATTDGSLDANYFQHEPYLISYDADSGLKEGDDGYLVSAGAIHYEPLGLYSDKHTSTDEIADGAIVAVPNDATNEARALFLLQDQGWITLAEDAAIDTAVPNDIKENPYNLEIKEVAADQAANLLPDVDFAVINGNYALSAGVTDKLLTTEAADSEAAKTYANIIAVKEANKDDEAITTLVEVLKSDDIKDFIKEKYGVSVVPAE